MNSLAKSESNSPAMSIKNAKITNNSRYQTTFIKADVLKQTNQKGKKKKTHSFKEAIEIYFGICFLSL
jgi:hypothetical protein